MPTTSSKLPKPRCACSDEVEEEFVDQGGLKRPFPEIGLSGFLAFEGRVYVNLFRPARRIACRNSGEDQAFYGHNVTTKQITGGKTNNPEADKLRSELPSWPEGAAGRGRAASPARCAVVQR